MQLTRARCKSDLETNHTIQPNTGRLVALSTRPCTSTAQYPYQNELTSRWKELAKKAKQASAVVHGDDEMSPSSLCV